MTTEETLQKAEEILRGLAYTYTRPEENRLDAIVPGQNLKPAVRALVLEKKWGYLSAITGLDHPEYDIDPVTKEKVASPEHGSVEVLYHFCDAAAVTTLRVMVPYADPSIDSVCDIVPGATLFERELMELFGVVCVGTPSTARLVLPDVWPDGVYPLRKSFKGLEKKIINQKG